MCNALLLSGKQEHMSAVMPVCLCMATAEDACAAPLSRHPAGSDQKSVLVPRRGGCAEACHAEGACGTSGGANCSDCWACRALSLLGPKCLQRG